MHLYKSSFKRIAFLLFVLILPSSFLFSQKEKSEIQVGIDEKLAEIVPADIFFYDENGDTIVFGDYVDRPTVISLVYYNCPGICTPLLSGMVEVLDQMDLKPGDDYQVITISFDSRDTPSLAKKKKKNYLNAFKKPYPENAWRWVCGDSVNIRKITEAVGFKFIRDKNDFAHSASLIVISPDRKITRYLYGITYLPFDLKMAVIEASEGRATPTITKLLKFCFSYDRAGQKYAFNFKRIGGGIILLSMIIFIISISVKSKKSKEKRGT